MFWQYSIFIWIALIIVITFLIIRAIYRWVKRIIHLWKFQSRKKAIVHMIKGIVTFILIGLGIYYIKAIAIAVVGVFVIILNMGKEPPIYYYDDH